MNDKRITTSQMGRVGGAPWASVVWDSRFLSVRTRNAIAKSIRQGYCTATNGAVAQWYAQLVHGYAALPDIRLGRRAMFFKGGVPSQLKEPVGELVKIAYVSFRMSDEAAKHGYRPVFGVLSQDSVDEHIEQAMFHGFYRFHEEAFRPDYTDIKRAIAGMYADDTRRLIALETADRFEAGMTITFEPSRREGRKR